jgi:hypothetical protein
MKSSNALGGRAAITRAQRNRDRLSDLLPSHEVCGCLGQILAMPISFVCKQESYEAPRRSGGARSSDYRKW